MRGKKTSELKTILFEKLTQTETFPIFFTYYFLHLSPFFSICLEFNIGVSTNITSFFLFFFNKNMHDF